MVEPIPPTSKNLRYSFLILGPGYLFPNILKQKYVRVLFVLQAIAYRKHKDIQLYNKGTVAKDDFLAIPSFQGCLIRVIKYIV